MKKIVVFLICIFVLIFIHEISHAFLDIIFGVTVENIIIGLPIVTSVHLNNQYVRNISFGPIVLMGFTVPNIDEYKLLFPWQSILISLAGPLSNFLIPLFGALMYKKGKRFSSNMIYFFDLSLILFFVNLAPLPYADGGKIVLNFLVMTGFLESLSEFYTNTPRLILVFSQYGGLFIMFVYLYPIINFFNRFIKYNSKKYA